MRISRREVVKLWAGAGASVMLGWRPRMRQESPLIHRAIPSTGEAVPAVALGARNYRVGPSATERAPLNPAATPP
jgi:hypothetical protein